MGLVHPTTKPAQHEGFNLSQKKITPGEAHSVLDILHQEPQYILKTINVLSPFLSLWHLYLGRLRQIDRHTEAKHETDLHLGLDEKIS